MKFQVLYFSISSDEEEEEDESDRETEDPAMDSLSAAIKYQVNTFISFCMYLLLVVIYKKNKKNKKLFYYLSTVHQSIKIQILNSMKFN